MELVDDIDECLHETCLLFKGKDETSASTSSYFQDEFPQFLSVDNHHIKFKASTYNDGYSKEYESPSSGIDESPYMSFRFAQKCRNIGGMTQTHDLSIKCKWKDNGEQLRLDMPESPICISRKCDASLFREQLSIELAKQVKQYLEQQVDINADPNALTELYGVLGNCVNSNMDGYCLWDTEDDETNCEQKGGQLITHKLQINYSGDLDDYRGIRQSGNDHSFTVFNYPHLNDSTQDAIGNLSKFDFSLKILNDDVIDYYDDKDQPNIDEIRSKHNREESNRQ